MSPALANFLFEAANLLLLAAALGWVLFKPVRAALDREKARHATDMEEAQRLRAEAESLANEARAARRAADAEIARQGAEMVAAAQKQAAALLEEARKAQVAERSTFLREQHAARERQTARLAEDIGCVAAESVRRLLLDLDGPDLELALVRAACEQLRTLPDSARQGAAVESARALDSNAKELLQAVLADHFTERTVPELGAGVRVTTRAGQVDASALSIAREAARAVNVAFTKQTATGGGPDA
jgi:F0F1-type ATP synthase membrane subunit b/b'